MSHSHFYSLGSLACLSALALIPFSGANAAVRIKANNNTPLNVAGSWDALPGMYDVASWTSVVSTSGNGTAALGGNVSWRGITIVNPVEAITIAPTGGSVLTLGNNGIDMNAATQNLTIQSGLTLLGNSGQTWNIGNGRTLTLNTGTFTRSAGATLNVQGLGTVSTSNITNGANGIIGAWATFGGPTATQYATISGGNIVGLTGTTAATAAAVTDTTGTANYDVQAVTGPLSAGASVNTLRYTGASGTIAGALTTNGLLNAGSGALTLSGPVTVGSTRELVVTTPDATRSITLSGGISDSATGSSGLTKAGDGTLTLSAASSYTGVTTISRGTVSISNSSALGSTAGAVYIHSGDNSSGAMAPGGTLVIGGGLTVADSIAITGGSGNPVTSISTSGTSTISGAFYAINSGVRLSTSGTLNFTGGMVANNAQVVFNGTQFNITSNPVYLGSGNFYADSGNASVIAVGVAGGIWGETTASAYIRTDVANALPTTTAVKLGVAYQTSGTLDLNGNNQTISQIRSDTFIAGSRIVTSAAPATLTVNQATSSVVDARFTGAVSLTKNGNGSLTIAGANNTTTGTFSVNRGTLIENFNYVQSTVTGAQTLTNNISASAPLVLGGGNFQVIGRSNGTATTAAGANWVNNSNLVNVTSTAGLAPGQTLSGGAGLPAGVFILSVLSPTQVLLSANTTSAQAATTITVAGASTATTSQTFNSVTLNSGGSGVSVNASGADATVLNLGTINRPTGSSGTVAFTLSTGTQSATNGITLNNTNTNSILGGWATIGDNWAVNSTNAAGGNVAALGTYVDVTRLESGTKTITSNAANNVRIVDGTGATPASITPLAAGTTDINTLLHSATTTAVTYDPGAGDILRLGAEGGILMASTASALNIGTTANDGTLTAGGATDAPGTLYLTNNHASNLLTVNSTIANNGAGQVSVTKAGAGTVVLAGTNTYTGKTVIGAGKISIASEAALGTIATAAADQLTLAGGTLLTTATFSLDDAGRGITLAPAGGTFEVNTGTTLTVANVIAGAGDLTKTGAGTLAVTNANTFTGDTLVNQNQGTLAVGNVNALQNSTLDTTVSGSQAVTFTVGGSNTYNIGGLRGADALDITTNRISVGANNISTTYSGVISGTTGGLTKVGSTILNLTAANTYAGDTIVSSGYLALGNTNALQNSTLDTGASGTTKGVILLPTASTYNVGGLKGEDDVDMGVNNLSVGSNNQSTTYSGALISTFTGSLTKVGTGTLSLTGQNAYNGATNVNVGGLQVGSGGVGRTGYGAVTVAANANLFGTGTVSGSSFTLSSNATLRAGDSTATNSHGTLTFSSFAGPTVVNLQANSTTILSLTSATNQGSIDPTFGNNAVGSLGYYSYLDGITGTGSHDRLFFNGTAGSSLLVNGKFNVVDSGFTAQAGQVFNLLDWTGSITPVFDSGFLSTPYHDGLADNGTIFDLPDLNTSVTGLYWDTSRFTSSGVIAVVSNIPEPSRVLLIVVAAMGLMMRRRRKLA